MEPRPVATTPVARAQRRVGDSCSYAATGTVINQTLLITFVLRLIRLYVMCAKC
jgi:hypothetical protein